MDIKITSRPAERTFPLEMAVDPEGRPGHCPFTGESLAFQYTGTFVETAKRTMALGQEFVRQLTLLAELAGGFSIDADSILDPIRDAMAAQDERIAEPWRPGWPPQPSEPVVKA